MNTNDFYFQKKHVKGPMKLHRIPCGRILVPDGLPIKLVTGSVRTTVNVGEFAILPENTVAEIENYTELFMLDFDFRLVSENPELALFLPLLMLPYICRQRAKDELSASLAGDLAPFVTLTAKKQEKKQPAYLQAAPIDIVRSLTEDVAAQRLFPATLALSFLNALYALIGTGLLASLRQKEETLKTAGLFEKFRLAIQFINNNYRNEITLADISRAAGCSHAHLSHSFREFYGVSVIDYLMRVRACAAAAMIADAKNRDSSESERISISDIAIQSGFSSSSTFNRIFKKEMGLAPRDYARLCTNDSL